MPSVPLIVFAFDQDWGGVAPVQLSLVRAATSQLSVSAGPVMATSVRLVHVEDKDTL